MFDITDDVAALKRVAGKGVRKNVVWVLHFECRMRVSWSNSFLKGSSTDKKSQEAKIEDNGWKMHRLSDLYSHGWIVKHVSQYEVTRLASD